MDHTLSPATTPVPDDGTRAVPPAPEPDRAQVRRAAMAGLVGTALENYDFVLYGTASALVFSQIFFPNVSPAVGVIASFGAYAVGFCARPLGGLFFSRYGDRLGRKWILVATLLLMGLSTLAIAFLPTYEQAGIVAPALLVLCRFGQGFGAGAEQSGGATLLTESAPRGKRGRMASFVMVGAASGTVLGAGAWALVQLLPEDQLMSWGWRAVFASSILVTIAAYVFRRKLQETPVFEEAKEAKVTAAAPVREVFRNGKRLLAIVTFMTVGFSVQSYTYQVFMASYLKDTVQIDAAKVPQILLVGAVFGGIAAWVLGALSDRWGRRGLFLAVAGALLVIPYPTFMALSSGHLGWIYVAMIVGFMLACQGGVAITMSYFPELFGSRYRYAGVTLGREFAAVLGGGFAPLIAASLVTAFSGSWLPVAIYMSLAMLLAFVAALKAPETLNRDLTDPRNAIDVPQPAPARA
ncbi:MFS transporter [Krasilnikoviella flava]|uniref:Predicted arabinose efflux permease, MFS family n=1 Tax=Krasilnikoviella flava TaxID=526729 RepID=A0A1T5KSF4_9MICO|nr:MFS transporter [Krasilnikoviella flava]SKC66198.1 Predicted arabinose efflux permease, MFS family [Krasilnikoviella flava]